jgi:hypothetical protein
LSHIYCAFLFLHLRNPFFSVLAYRPRLTVEWRRLAHNDYQASHGS